MLQQVQGNKESQSNIATYIQVLSKVLPKTVKLPRFEYGSKGILGYYNSYMDDMLQFSDLRTVVFQAFREIGNAVLFTLHLEQALVRVPATPAYWLTDIVMVTCVCVHNLCCIAVKE